MKVAYITMGFPSSSETFATTDVRVLREAGVDISVYTLRPPVGDPARLLDERGLSGLAVSQGTLWAHLEGVASCLRRPLLSARLALWLFRVTSMRGNSITGRADPGDPPQHETAPQERLRNLTMLQLLVSLAFVPRSVGIFAALEREQPDVVHLFWGHYPCLVGYLALTRLRQNVVSLFLGAHDLNRRFGGSTWLAQRADVVSTHARWNLAAIAALGVPADRIHLAYRGIDPGSFNADIAAKIRHRVVCAGRLEQGKGIDDVVRAFSSIHGRWPDATLTILGDGQERQTIEQLVQSLGIGQAVIFRGHVSQQQLARELAAAEVFLHMSWEDTERLPNVVKEAMASRCLCVVTQTPGIEELVKDGEQGFVVAARDVPAATARIDDAFSGRIDVTLMLDRAARHVANNFNVIESMRSYRQRWQDALTRRRVGPVVTTTQRIDARTPATSAALGLKQSTHQ